MERLVSIILALVTYVTSLSTAIPALVSDIEDSFLKHIVWMVDESEISEVDYDEIYAFHQENYVPLPSFGKPENYPDLTEDYIKLLEDNLKIAMEWKKDPINGQINFYNAVKNFGVWDYKRPDAHPDWHSKTKNGYFTAFGVVMNWEVIGNINFAFTGAAVGFSEKTILTGGGLVNVMGGHGRWDEIQYYFDDKEDNDWITFGIDLYKLYDKEYEDESSMIDNFLTIVDPRVIGGYMILDQEREANGGQFIVPTKEEIKGALEIVMAEYGLEIELDSMSYTELLELLNALGIKIPQPEVPQDPAEPEIPVIQ